MFSAKQAKVIHESVDHVWNRIHDFHRLDWAPNVIERVDKVGHLAGNAAGARRLLNGTFSEMLLSVDEAKHQYRYSIDDGPSPISKDDVSNYVGVVQLNETSDGQTEMVWSSSWDSNSEDAVEFCNRIYIALMAELDKSFH
ncbi:MAG: SRPBCC family protein [Psychromonas sp.]|nr:SRPBCC family protein [Psychromonas sp.]